MFLSLARITKFALQNFWRNIWLSIVTITIIMLTLLSLTSLVLVNVITDHALDVVKSKFNVSLTFKPEVPVAKTDEVRQRFAELPYVAEVTVIAPEQALEDFKTTHADDTTVMEALNTLNANPFGTTLVIRPVTLSSYQTLREKIDEFELSPLLERADTQSYQRIVNRLQGVSRRVELAGLAVSGFFAVISLLIVFNSIRIGIYSHRDEIAIMRLVGATNWFIRGPFIIEALLYTIITCALFWSIFLPSAGALNPHLEAFLGGIGFDVQGWLMVNLWNIIGFEFVAVLVLTTISSMLAIARYLKV